MGHRPLRPQSQVPAHYGKNSIFIFQFEFSRQKLFFPSVSSSVQNLVDSCVSVLVTSHKETILSDCADMIRANETEKLQLMFKLMDRVPDEGIAPMLADLEAHIYANGIADMVESADVITQDSEKYVEKLLALFRRFSQLVSEAFRYDFISITPEILRCKVSKS